MSEVCLKAYVATSVAIINYLSSAHCLPSLHPAVCVQYLNRQTGICEGQNLGKFYPATDIETTAEEKCCNIPSAGAYYDTVTKSCLSCENGKQLLSDVSY